jgi:hypothetical protein
VSEKNIDSLMSNTANKIISLSSVFTCDIIKYRLDEVLIKNIFKNGHYELWLTNRLDDKPFITLGRYRKFLYD